MSPKQLTTLSISVLLTERVQLSVFLISGNGCFQKTKQNKKNHIASRLRSTNSHCFLSRSHLCSLIKTNFLKGQFNFVIPLPTELSQSIPRSLNLGSRKFSKLRPTRLLLSEQMRGYRRTFRREWVIILHDGVDLRWRRVMVPAGQTCAQPTF